MASRPQRLLRSTATRLLLASLLAGCVAAGPPPAAAPAGPADPTVEVVRRAAQPLSGNPDDFDALMDLVGDARVVLLGEATHGTHEFYVARATITRRLVEEKGFTAVAVEADWPEAFRVNEYVRGMGPASNARQALAGFDDFPAWMWRNTDVQRLVEWLARHNAGLPAERRRVGFYGIDLQTLAPAIEGVTSFLGEVDPAAAERARRRYACFGRYRNDPLEYAQMVESRGAESCAGQAVQQVREFDDAAAAWAERSGEEELFGAAWSARLVRRAEEYFRAHFTRETSSWNLRDRYMADVVQGLLDRPVTGGGRVVVWAHNSHVGDARATHMGDMGELNLGQLARERWGRDAVLIGFTTHSGGVMASSDWGGPAGRKRVRPALSGSYEDLFHATGIPRFYLPLRNAWVAEALRAPRLQRAIGVIYLPRSERVSHYSHAILPEQFDAVIHYDETTPVQPLDRPRPGPVD